MCNSLMHKKEGRCPFSQIKKARAAQNLINFEWCAPRCKLAICPGKEKTDLLPEFKLSREIFLHFFYFSLSEGPWVLIYWQFSSYLGGDIKPWKFPPSFLHYILFFHFMKVAVVAKKESDTKHFGRREILQCFCTIIHISHIIFWIERRFQRKIQKSIIILCLGEFPAFPDVFSTQS